VIQAIPNAIGALCLNQVGQDQLAARPSIIPGIFSIFTSDRHLKVLQDKENAALIGATIDELIRHHPLLRIAVFDSIKSTLSKIEELGDAYVPPVDIQHWYKLIPVPADGADGGTPMEGIETEGIDILTLPDHEISASKLEYSADEGAPKTHDNNVVSYIDVLCRVSICANSPITIVDFFVKFLEGLFQHANHCRDFIALTDGLQRLGRITALPCLPYDYANSVISDSLVQVMRTMTEVATTDTIVQLASQVEVSLEETKSFWDSLESESKLLPLVDVSSM
jgi:E3 ubiquitin-protein ligase HUWE1